LFFEKFTHFYLQQITLTNSNLDIGVQVEEIKCSEYIKKQKPYKRNAAFLQTTTNLNATNLSVKILDGNI